MGVKYDSCEEVKCMSTKNISWNLKEISIIVEFNNVSTSKENIKI